jgi:Fe-S cluster assembly protein SufD
MSVESRNDYLDNLLHGREAVADAGSAWQRKLRMRAVERANELTVPTTRDEEWRFTDLSPLYRMAFRPAANAGTVEKLQIDAFAIPEAATRLVFVDGPNCRG